MKTFERHNSYITRIRFSPDGKAFVLVSDDAQVDIWNAERLELEQPVDRTCPWLRDYLQHNIRVNKGDRQICDRK